MVHCVASQFQSGDHVLEACPKVPSKIPEVWGPSGWFFLHVMAANYPTEPDAEYTNACSSFVSSLPYMLPCGDCGKHLQKLVRETDLAHVCATRDNLHSFVSEAHNKVNVRNGKDPQTCELSRWLEVPLCR